MAYKRTALFALLASTLVAAQPHGHRRHNQEKRDVVTVLVTAPIVYVDQFGNVIEGPTTSTPAPALINVSPSTYAVPAATTPAAVASSYSAPAAASSSASSSNGIFGKALVYSPYHNDGTCKSASDVSTDLNSVMSGYAGVRLYGVDCNQVPNVLAVARKMNFKVMLGIYDITQAAADATTIVSAVGGDWSVVHSIGSGNEVVNKAILSGQDGNAAVAQSLAAAEVVRGIVKAAGFTGPVVTPDVFHRFTEFPALCGSESWVAINCHPFFDGGITADQSGTFYTNNVAKVKSACGKNVLVTETGWPTQGMNNGVAVPSKDNQNTVVSQGGSALDNDYIVLGAFNDMWKQNNAATFDAEQYWGVHGASVTN